MRVTAQVDGFRVKAIAGIHTVLMAIDCDEDCRDGLLGFGFQREVAGSGSPKWLRSLKVFPSLVPNPRGDADSGDAHPTSRYTNEHPIQSFLWGDYAARPDTSYRFLIYPMKGEPGALVAGAPMEVEIKTEPEFHAKHGVWFNRGAIASQKFAEEFHNQAPSDINDPEDPEVKWLSRGLLEACLAYINDTPDNWALRVAAYEFTYPPVLAALKAAIERGVDVRIVYHHTKTKNDANVAAIKATGLPNKTQTGERTLFPRTKTKIPHNKFMVRLDEAGNPAEVWTGSTNFTDSGFLGQTNVGHWVADAHTADIYNRYWEIVRKDPDLDAARKKVLALTPDPDALIAPRAIVPVFSPRAKADLLKWYAARMDNCASSAMFTAAFGVAKQLEPAIAGPRELLRFLLMEKPPTEAQAKKFKNDRDHLIVSYGIPLGEYYEYKKGKPARRRRIKEFGLEEWFYRREKHFRPSGFVFFVHTKFLLIDPLSDDPLVCSGSANFSSNSLLQNDENMLLIRGDTRVADIYLTEFDRIFRHFYFRDVANEIEAKGDKAEAAFLDETNSWTEPYFTPGSFKTLRREMFFADPKPTWCENAMSNPNGTVRKRAAKKAARSAKEKPTTHAGIKRKKTAKKKGKRG